MDGFRKMIDIKEKNKCCGCYACFNKCPTNAIEMKKDEKGFSYPIVNKEKCVNCGLCEKACPILKKEKEKKNDKKAYACINKNDNIRNQSSSGGIFTLLAEEIIKKGGVVFGATFNEKFEVMHDCAEGIEDLVKFRGSKYVQSSINSTYQKAKEFLESDKYVLFTGTPCQIEGLKSYLDKEYDKLYTQDIICHGVPSATVWNKYLEYREKRKNSKIKKVEFRNKEKGWHLYNLRISYENDEVYERNQRDDIFMKAFLRNTILRDSCYQCYFKKINRMSDITLADFWGIEKVLPEMDDNKGVSLVITNTKKGEELLEKITSNIISKEIKLEDAIKFNKSFTESAPMDKNREKFFENLDKIDFEKLVKKYTNKPNILIRVVRKMKSLIAKIIK